MSATKIIREKCSEMGIVFTTKTRIQTLKAKLAELGVDVEALISNNTTPFDPTQRQTEIANIVPDVVQAVLKELKRHNNNNNNDTYL